MSPKYQSYPDLRERQLMLSTRLDCYRAQVNRCEREMNDIEEEIKNRGKRATVNDGRE